MDLRELAGIVRRRWAIIVLFTLIAAGVAAYYNGQATPRYKSTAHLFVSTLAPEAEDTYRSGSFTGQRVKSYAVLVSGHENARRVISKLKLDMDPRALARNTTASVEPDTVILSVSVTDSSAKRAQLLAQTSAEVLVDHIQQVETPPGKTKSPIKASVVDRATEPLTPISPRPVRNVLLAVALGLLFGGAFAVLRDRLDTRIRGIDDLRRVAGDLPLLGSIHFERSASSRPLITDLPNHSPRSEAFRVLRTNLRFINPGATSRMYAFTSALPAAGKTTTVTNLALSLAQTGARTLLIEGDLRRPKVTTYLGIPGQVGVTTVLIGATSLDEAIQSLPKSTDILASGIIPPNPAELLESEPMRKLLNELRRRYDYILIDTPPALPVTDAAIIASQCDGAILVVSHGSTTQEHVKHVMERFATANATIVGVVVNRVPAPRRFRGHSHGYGYGYGYGYAPEATAGKRRAAAGEATESSSQPAEEVESAAAQLEPEEV